MTCPVNGLSAPCPRCCLIFSNIPGSRALPNWPLWQGETYGIASEPATGCSIRYSSRTGCRVKHRVLPQNRLQGAEYGIAPEPAAGCSLVWSATWAANPRFLQGQHTAAPKTLEIPSARTAPTQCPLVFSQVGGQFSQLFKDFDALSQSS